MADLGLSLGVPHAAPVGAIGQQPNSTPRKQEQRKREREAKEKQKPSLQPLSLLDHDHADKADAAGGKGALVDIVA